nr:uncharacterized mitochondrial protein AtMg00810-like [Tanacetum cinerariifolium]
MSTQQDIYAAGFENRPPMLNKVKYVSWSSRLLWYAKSRPNGKLIHNSIINGPYVRRMIPEPGDTNHEVPINETFHVQPDDELTKKEIKQIKANDQAIQTILLGLPEDIYAAVDSCETAQEIRLRVQQMMKGSDIRIQKKKAKLFNELERFTSNDGESIESYYHRFLKLMNDLKQNKHFLEKIARNANQNLNGNGNLVAARAKGIQLQAKEFDLMAATADLDEIKEVNANCILMANLQQASASGGTVEQHPANVEETRGLYDSLYNNLSIEVEKVNTVNRKLKETNAELTTELARFKIKKSVLKLVKKNMTNLKDVIKNLNKQLSKEKSTVSFLLEEKKKLRSDFKFCEDELLDKQIQLEKRIKELDNILVKTGQSIKTIYMLSPKPDLFYHTEQKMDLGYQNPFYLKQAQKQQESLYDGKVLLKKHDPHVVHDSEETLQLGQEKAAKFVGDFKSLVKEADESLAKNKALELEIERLMKAVLSQDIIHFNSIPTPQESKVVKNDKVIATGMFRINPFKTSREEKHISDNTTLRPEGHSLGAIQRMIGSPLCLRVVAKRIKNKGVEVEEHHRNLLLSKNKKHISSVCNNVKFDSQNVKSKVVCAMCKQCLISVNHDVCLLNYVNGKTSRGKKQKANVSINEKQKKQQPKVKKTNESESQSGCSNGDNAYTSNPLEPNIKRFLNSSSLLGSYPNFLWRVDSGCSKHMIRNLKLPINFVWKFLGTVRFGNDYVAIILGFGDLQWGNILITRVYFIEGLGHNLFSVGQFCDSYLEVAFRRNACFVRNLEGVDLLKGDRSTNLYTINLHDMASASPICLIARLPKFKYHKEHLCSLCEQRKSKRPSHPPKPVPNSRQRLHLLHMDLYGPMRIASINGKRKPDMSFLHVFGALCYPKNYREDIGKLGAKDDIGFFIGYSSDSCTYRIYNRRTKEIMETMNVSFDELSAMDFEQRSELDLLFEAMYDDYIGGQPSAALNTILASHAHQVRQASMTSTSIADSAPTPTNSSSHATNFPNTSHDVDELNSQQQHAQQQGNQAHLQSKIVADNVPNAMFDGNTFVNRFANPSTSAAESSSSQNVDPSNMHTFYQPYPHEFQWTKDHPLEQSNYVLEILKKYGMESCDPVGTPMQIKDKLDLDQHGTPVDATKYHSMIGALMYLTSSRADIVHATCLCARYQAKPTEKHLKEVKRIFRYLQGTVNTGLWYMKDSGFELTRFSDADYAGCKDTFKSTSGGAQFLGKKLVSLSSKKQDCTTLSTVEAEYVSLSACYAQVLWMRTQLTDYGFHFKKILIYYDSKSTIAISCNPTNYQLADLFTKALPADRFNYLVRRLELLHAPTEGYAEAIVVSPILTEQFELKHSLINMMTSNQFFGLEKDNPRDRIHWFNKITSTIKYKDVPNSAIKLMLFPFSLVGVARRWLEKEPRRSIHTWKDLVSKFINEFFPPSRTTNLRNKISNFEQRFDESFHEAWDRYKYLLRACPHHGFTELHQLDTFYNALNPADQDSLNAAAGGNLLERRTQDVDSQTYSRSQSATPPPASIKAVKDICVTCGGAHPYYQYLATDGNTFPELRDNIQGYILAPAVNYNQGNSVYRPP